MLTHATDKQLERAAADNYRQLACLEALAWGGEIKEQEGLLWTYAGPANGAVIPFPDLTPANAGRLLDAMLNYYRQHPSLDVMYWSLSPAEPAGIAARLLARGFQIGWLPCWMAVDLDQLNEQCTAPAGVQVQADGDTDIHLLTSLPYSSANNALSPACRKAYPDRSQRFLATANGKVLGQSAVFFSTGEDGVAGIYNVGVVPKARGKGIGKAVTLAACLYAKEKGYRYAVLNATGMGRPVYEQLGFQWKGNGFTWCLVEDRHRTHPPTAVEVAVAEAVGLGDVTALDSIHQASGLSDFNKPLSNKMTLMELAVYCQQPAAADWLISHNADYTALDAWDLGWKDRTAALLAANPQEVNRRYREGNITLLHKAVERNDEALAALVLQANADLTLRDSWHNSTALGWAVFFNHTPIIDMIRTHGGTT